jgi:hypothetical protein
VGERHPKEGNLFILFLMVQKTLLVGAVAVSVDALKYIKNISRMISRKRRIYAPRRNR